MEQVEIAVVGAGVIGKRHIELVSASNSCRLVAICDVNTEARSLAESRSVPYYEDVETMLGAAKPDAVIVATPNDQHGTVGIACANRGVDALIEKPIAASAAEGRLMVEASRANETQLMVGHHRRFNPIIQKTRALVTEGSLGKLLSATFLWMLRKPQNYYDASWRVHRPGGGPVLINLIHEIDSLRYVCGEIKSVFAVTKSAARNFQVEDTASITITFESGAVGTISASDATPAPWSWEATMAENPMYFHVPENFGMICGTRGSLAIPSMEFRYYANEEGGWEDRLEVQRFSVDALDPLTAQLEHFCMVIRREETPIVSGIDALRTLAATLAVNESSRLNIPIEPTPVQ